MCLVLFFYFVFKRKTAYEMRMSDWSSDVCSSDLEVRMRVDDAGCTPFAGAVDDAHAGREIDVRADSDDLAGGHKDGSPVYPLAGAGEDRRADDRGVGGGADRKSTRLNSSH